MNYIFSQILAPIKVSVSINLARGISDTVNDSVDRIEMVRGEVSPQWLALFTEGYLFPLLLKWFVEILIVVPLWFRPLTTRRFYFTHRLVAKYMSDSATCWKANWALPMNVLKPMQLVLVIYSCYILKVAVPLGPVSFPKNVWEE